MTESTPSNLVQVLQSGHFAMTAETSPPDAASAEVVLQRVECLKGIADAVNVTDGASARVHMSALATAAIMARAGIEPVMQLTTRDRNRHLGASCRGDGLVECVDLLECNHPARIGCAHQISDRVVDEARLEIRRRCG